MSQLTEQSREDHVAEGGMFYPKGFIVAAFDSTAGTQQAEAALQRAGFAASDITRVSSRDMQAQARANLDKASIIAGIGSSVAVRQKQFELAEEGCDFLLIHAQKDEQEANAVQALSAGPVRYAVKYRTLVIENLLPKIPSANPDPEPARASGSSR